MQYYNSNQLEAVRAAADNDEIDMLRGPSQTGNATDRKTWYKASMLWSASARTENPEAAIALDQLVRELRGGRRHRQG